MTEQEQKSSDAGSTPETSADMESGFFSAQVDSTAGTQALLAKAMHAAEPNAIFGAPVERGAYTVITCSEVGGGLGAGFGGGKEGSGGGGGGGSFGRPVAVITIGPAGVDVQPVFDKTKVGIAALAAFGALLMSWGRMKG